MTDNVGMTLALPPRPVVDEVETSSYTILLPSGLKLNSTFPLCFFSINIASCFLAASSMPSKYFVSLPLSSFVRSPLIFTKCLPVLVTQTPRYPGTRMEPSGSFSSGPAAPACANVGPFFLPTTPVGPCCCLPPFPGPVDGVPGALPLSVAPTPAVGWPQERS
jgi:hypothetical protein